MSTEVEKIRENVHRSIKSAFALKEILINERMALEEKDTHLLAQCALNKKRCVNQLDVLERQRTNLKFDELDREPWIDVTNTSSPDQSDTDYPSSWNEFLDIVRSCNELNVANGAIIRARQTQIQAAISLLRGGQVSRETYNQSGQNTDTSAIRSLAKA